MRNPLRINHLDLNSFTFYNLTPNYTLEKLTSLINTLTAKEKSQFVKFSKQHLSERTSKTLGLFNELNRSLSNSKGKLETIYSRYPPSIKSLLYNQILRCLSFYATESPSALTRKHIMEANFLIERGLFKQAMKRLDKAKKIAIDGHLHLQFLEISLLRRRIIRRFKTKDLDILLQEENEGSKKRTQWIKEQFDILSIYEYYFVNYRQHDLKKVTLLSKDFSKLSDEKIESFEGNFLANLTSAMINRANGNLDDSLHNHGEVIRALEANPTLLKENFPRFIRSIKNYINTCFRLGMFDQASEKIEELKNTKAVTFINTSLLKSLTITSEVMLNLYNKKYYIITQKAEGIKANLIKYRNVIPPENIMAIYNNISIAFYFQNKIDEALEWVSMAIKAYEVPHPIERNTSREVGTYFYSICLSFRIVLFLELNNATIAKRLIPQALYFLRQKGLEKTPMKEILVTVREVIYHPEQKNEKLEALTKTLAKQKGYEAFKHWLDTSANQKWIKELEHEE